MCDCAVLSLPARPNHSLAYAHAGGCEWPLSGRCTLSGGTLQGCTDYLRALPQSQSAEVLIASLRLHRLLAGVVTHLPSLPAYPPSMLEDPAYLERLRPGHHLGCPVWCWLCDCRDEIPTSVSLQVCMHPWEARCLMWLLSSFVPCHLPFMFLSDPSCVPCREGIGSLGCRRLPPIRPPAPLGCLCLELGGVDWSVVHSPPNMQ